MPLRLIASYVVGSGAEAVWIALSLHASSTSKYASSTVVLKAAIQTMYVALAWPISEARLKPTHRLP